MKFIELPSPNFDARNRDVDMIILHYTGMKTGEEARQRLCDKASKVSAHYVIEENGDCYRLVDEQNRAWHAGVSSWRGDAETNARSIGVEIVNPGHEFGYRAFPDAQIDVVIALLKGIRTRFEIPLRHILGHSDVAPRRKEDPGEKFPWDRLAAEGLGVPPFDGDASAQTDITYEEALRALSAIGYDAPQGDHAAALIAFQRHYCPASLGQGFDPRTKDALISVERAVNRAV